MCECLVVFTRRLEEEEQSRQKLQLEKVPIDAKLKQFEEKAVALQDSNAKVHKDGKGTSKQKQDGNKTIIFCVVVEGEEDD